VVRERWVKPTEDKRQQNEEEIIGILFMYLFEYIPSIIYYVKALALLLFRSSITIVCIVLFIFIRESSLHLRCEYLLMEEKEESLKKLKM